MQNYTDFQKYQISTFSRYTGGRISVFSITDWLEKNFKPSEFDVALEILGRVNYYRQEHIISEYDHSLKKIVTNTGFKNFFILPYGNAEKSGTHMLYYLKQTNVYRDRDLKWNILDPRYSLTTQGVGNNHQVIFLDDFIGSGETFIKFYNEKILPELNSISPRFSIVSVAAMEFGIDAIAGIIDERHIFGTRTPQAFIGEGLFVTQERRSKVQELAERYGKGLFIHEDRASRTKVDHFLGYNNSQALIILDHSIPNNTLPIIWSSSKKWIPLVPRSSALKLSRIREERNELWLWLAILAKIDYDNGKATYSQGLDLDSPRAQILCFLKLKRMDLSLPTACQLMGISVNEYERIFAAAVNEQFADENGAILPSGFDILQALDAKVRASKTNQEKNKMKSIFENYIPRSFGGSE